MISHGGMAKGGLADGVMGVMRFAGGVLAQYPRRVHHALRDNRL